ncbi:MAG TPA: sigma factor [Nostocaceae cyanobacterium]|nr:sigma factor [Nostocaceae cyanobacterium]
MNTKSYIQTHLEPELVQSLSGQEITDVLPKQRQLRVVSPNNYWDFWQVWESSQNYFYKCCLQWMGGNYHDAEDALNQAMLKAWKEWPKYANEIIYPKAWLTRRFVIGNHQYPQKASMKKLTIK